MRKQGGARTYNARVAGDARKLAGSAASPEEAAAIVAALERFMRATAPGPSGAAPAGPDGWHAAALLEGVERDPWAMPAESWL